MRSNTVLIRMLTKQIIALETQIKELISEDEHLGTLATQLQSVPGAAPFSHTSGISVFGKNTGSVYGDKSLKKIASASDERYKTRQ